MAQTIIKTSKMYLSLPELPNQQEISLPEIRCTFTKSIKILLQHKENSVTTHPLTQSNPEELLDSLKTQASVYQASVSRQLAADLPPDIEQTALKDEPKDWFIKTADYGDECDRLLQHRDGEYTQLLEDIARYHQIFQQGCDRIILLRPPLYSGYDIQLTAAMQCLGYTKEQFQFIIVQPIKLYAFHEPTQRIHPIPDLAPQELLKAMSLDALRWHSLRVSLAELAPINLSTAGQPTPENSLYRVQWVHFHCSTLLHQAHKRGIIQLDTTHDKDWAIAPTPMSLTEYVWEDANASTLVNQVQATTQILEQSAIQIAPHLICQHLEAISKTYIQWSDSLSLTQQNCTLLLAVKQTIFELLENILDIKASQATTAL